MKPQGPIILLSLIAVGTVLAYLSEKTLPLGFGVTALWLGIVVTANGSIWFGGWGVLAGVLFPVLAGQLQGLDLDDSLLAVLPNLLAGFIPALAFRRAGVDPALHDRRSVAAYGIWAVAAPSLASGVLAALSWWLAGKADLTAVFFIAFDWSLSNMVVLAVLGIPAAYALTPVFRRHGWLVRGWWR